MNRLERASVLSCLIQTLRESGSWTGETHVQKAAYLLQHAAGVPLSYEFVLYKHGPFSFDLRDELDELAADRLLVVEPQGYPYGPKLGVTPIGERNLELRSDTVGRYQDAINRVIAFVGARGVGTLERLATAFLMHEQRPNASDDELAEDLVAAKPYVGRFDALSAVREVRQALPTLQQNQSVE
jgi:hypothetical protein